MTASIDTSDYAMVDLNNEEGRLTMNLLRRAVQAHIRSGAPGVPDLALSGAWDLAIRQDGVVRTYIALADQNRLLATYRLRPCGRLARMPRVPAYLIDKADPVKVHAFQDYHRKATDDDAIDWDATWAELNGEDVPIAA